MKFSMTQLALAVSLAGAVSGAGATVLGVNSIVGSVDIVAGGFGGTLLDSAITNISNISYTGIARTAVYDTGTGLDFYYQFSNDLISMNGIERFSGYDYGSLGTQNVGIFQTAAAFGMFTAGTEASDGADRTGLGVIGISFVPNGLSKVNPGTTSYTQIVRTTARNYQRGNFGLLDGFGDNAAGFAPAIDSTPTAVPEPETYALFLSGLGLLGAYQWRRDRASKRAA